MQNTNNTFVLQGELTPADKRPPLRTTTTAVVVLDMATADGYITSWRDTTTGVVVREDTVACGTREGSSGGCTLRITAPPFSTDIACIVHPKPRAQR